MRKVEQKLDQKLIKTYHIDGLVQDCSISIANTLAIQQSCTKPSTFFPNKWATGVFIVRFCGKKWVVMISRIRIQFNGW